MAVWQGEEEGEGRGEAVGQPLPLRVAQLLLLCVAAATVLLPPPEAEAHPVALLQAEGPGVTLPL